MVGEPKGFPFGTSMGEGDRNRGIFPGETCEALVVRGTTSFYNNKLQIFSCWIRCCVECLNVIK